MMEEGARQRAGDLARRLDRAGARLARAEGRRDALEARCRELEKSVAEAKGRLALRDEVEVFIEAAQAEASRRNLASFEALLTSLVQEVLPGEKPVSLELSTERGLAALDIGVTRPNGGREDVLEDNGGALTNVVGMALRLIAVVKSGIGRFLALDEADCWIAPDRVSAFYHVLEDSAARLGIQCLAVTHHELAGIAESRVRVARVTGDPALGVSVLCPDGPPAVWDDAADGLRYIRLVNVQAFADATLPLGPGVNALVGPNNRGKSTFVRALRAVFYGEARDSLVRAGCPAARIEIGVERGRTLRFSRQPRRTPVNIWSLHEADGSLVEEHGTRLETGGRAVPDWVERRFGIRRVEGLDVQIAHQKMPVFLLDQPPSRRSAVLSIGQEAGYLRAMLAIHRERCTRDLALVRAGERELADAREALERLAPLAPLAAKVAEFRDRLAAHAAQSAAAERLGRHAAGLREGRLRFEAARRKADACRDVPDPDRLSEISAGLGRTGALCATADRLAGIRAALGWATARADTLAGLPAAAPSLVDASPMRSGAARLAGLGAVIAESRDKAAKAAREAARLDAEAAALVADSGGLCPVCGAPAGTESLLGAHARAA